MTEDEKLMQQALTALIRGRQQVVGALVQQDQDWTIAALKERLNPQSWPPCNHHCRQGRECPNSGGQTHELSGVARPAWRKP